MGSKQTILVACATLGPWSPSNGEPPPGKRPAMAVERRLRGDAQVVGGVGGQPTAGDSLSQDERHAVSVETKAALIASYQVLIGSHAEALSLKEDVLPAARKVFEAAHVGYETGKFGYLDVLDAQQTLFEVSMQYVDALGAYHTALAGAKRLAGWELQ